MKKHSFIPEMDFPKYKSVIGGFKLPKRKKGRPKKKIMVYQSK